MPPFYIEVQNGLKEVERNLAVAGVVQTCTYKGKSIPCVPSSVGRETIVDADGNLVQVDLRLIVRRDQFLTADSSLITSDSEEVTADNDTPTPISGWRLQFRSVDYRIITAKESGPKSHFELTLAEWGSNA